MTSFFEILAAVVRVNLRVLCSLLLVPFLLSACATSAYHGFEFNMRRDDQNAVVLDYRYGTSSHWIGHTQDEFKDGRVFWWESSGAQFSRSPEFLYVKWRNLTTKEVFQEKVDLRNRLPSDLSNKVVSFLIKKDRLYVYVISWDPRPPNTPPNGPKEYWGKAVVSIYPDQRAQ